MFISNFGGKRKAVKYYFYPCLLLSGRADEWRRDRADTSVSASGREQTAAT
jgi:hypothetical protein